MSIYFILTIVLITHSIFIQPAACSDTHTQQPRKILFLPSKQVREQDLNKVKTLRDEYQTTLEQNPDMPQRITEYYRRRINDLNVLVEILKTRAPSCLERDQQTKEYLQRLYRPHVDSQQRQGQPYRDSQLPTFITQPPKILSIQDTLASPSLANTTPSFSTCPNFPPTESPQDDNPS